MDLLKLHEWDWLGKTQRAVVSARTGVLAFHYRKADAETVQLIVDLANAAIRADEPDGGGLRELAERHLSNRSIPPGHAAYRDPGMSDPEWRRAYFVLAEVALSKLNECWARVDGGSK